MILLLILQAKLQLFQEYRALFEIFCWKSFACFFQVERLPKSLRCSKPGKKPLLRPTEHQKLNSVANMDAKIDIDALKSKYKKKSKTNEAENLKKIKNCQS